MAGRGRLGAPREPNVLPVGRDRVHRALPEPGGRAARRDVVERHEPRGVELGGVERADRDLAVVLVVREACEDVASSSSSSSSATAACAAAGMPRRS